MLNKEKSRTCTGVKTGSHNWFGIILIIIGVFFLIDILDISDFGNIISEWWPVILIIIGVVKFRSQDKRLGMVLFLLGLAFLLSTLGILNWSNIFRFWPVILIAVGLSMVMKSRKIKTDSATSKNNVITDDFVKANAIFGGFDKNIHSQNLQGGEAFALFGGVDLDLKPVTISNEGCVFNLTAMFGGIDVTVPENVRVSTKGFPFFGGIEDKTTPPDDIESAPIIEFNCTLAFSGIEIKN